MSGLPDTATPPAHAWLTRQSFAHRGLHGQAIAENGRSAFDAAIAAGYGIELDVRLSRDGFAMVFHDADLERLTGAAGPVAGRTAAELSQLTLAGGHDRIETLAATLRFVARRAPLLIELKTDGDPHVAARLCLSVRHALEGYRGKAAAMSFDPAVPAWFAAHSPQFARGLVFGGRKGAVAAALLLRRARPHFIAHDVAALPSPLSVRARRLGLPVLAWTVRTPDDHARAQLHADEIIFEAA